MLGRLFAEQTKHPHGSYNQNDDRSGKTKTQLNSADDSDLYDIVGIFIAISNELLFLTLKNTSGDNDNLVQAMGHIADDALIRDIKQYIQQYWNKNIKNQMSLCQASTKIEFTKDLRDDIEIDFIFGHHVGNLLIGLLVTHHNHTSVSTTSNRSLTSLIRDHGIHIPKLEGMWSESSGTRTSTSTSNSDDDDYNRGKSLTKQDIHRIRDESASVLSKYERQLLKSNFDELYSEHIINCDILYQIINFIYCQLCVVFKKGLVECVENNIDFLDSQYKNNPNDENMFYQNKIKLLKLNHNTLKNKLQPLFNTDWTKENINILTMQKLAQNTFNDVNEQMHKKTESQEVNISTTSVISFSDVDVILNDDNDKESFEYIRCLSGIENNNKRRATSSTTKNKSKNRRRKKTGGEILDCNPRDGINLLNMMKGLSDQNEIMDHSLHCVLIGCEDGGNALNRFRNYLMTGMIDPQVEFYGLVVYLFILFV